MKYTANNDKNVFLRIQKKVILNWSLHERDKPNQLRADTNNKANKQNY